MPIKLEWIDGRTGITEHRIYRSDTKLDQGNLGVPIATVDGATKSYVDTTVKRGVTYNYIVTSMVDGDEGQSANYYMGYFPDTGPGPQTIIRGDWQFGLFGVFPMENFFSADELIDQCAPGEITKPTQTGNVWVKVICHGKIIFFPVLRPGQGISYKRLYELGLVFGNKKTSEIPPAIIAALGAPVAPKVLTFGDNTFVVRLPTSRENSLSTSTLPADLTGGEIDQCMSPMYLTQYITLPGVPRLLDSVGNDTTTTLLLSQDYHSGTGTSARFVARRGGAGAIDDLYMLTNNLLTEGSGSVGWRPILELQV